MGCQYLQCNFLPHLIRNWSGTGLLASTVLVTSLDGSGATVSSFILHLERTDYNWHPVKPASNVHRFDQLSHQPHSTSYQPPGLIYFFSNNFLFLSLSVCFLFLFYFAFPFSLSLSLPLFLQQGKSKHNWFTVRKPSVCRFVFVTFILLGWVYLFFLFFIITIIIVFLYFSLFLFFFRVPLRSW